MASAASGPQQPIRFGDGFELDLRPLRLRFGNRVLKMERIPLEILAQLLEREGEVVGREEIVARIWGAGVFLDTDNSIRGAVRKLRYVLKDDAKNPRFIQTLTGQGYRFIGRLDPSHSESGAIGGAVQLKTIELAASSSSEVPHRLRLVEDDEPRVPSVLDGGSERGRRKRTLSLAGVMLLLIAVTATTYLVIRGRTGAVPKATSIAVLPFSNLSGDPAQEYLTDSMTEAIIGHLSRTKGVRVISRTSVMQFKDNRLTTPEIAEMLGADVIVEGAMLRDGDRVRVHARLIEGHTDEHFWSEQYDRDSSDVFALQSDIAKAIAEKVQATVKTQMR